MLIQELQEAIIKNQIDFLIGNKIIFTGEETYLENTYLDYYFEFCVFFFSLYLN